MHLLERLNAVIAISERVIQVHPDGSQDVQMLFPQQVIDLLRDLTKEVISLRERVDRI